MHMSCSVFLWFQAEDGIRDAQESRGLKQKTAYEMLRSLVGSEMCIRDRCYLSLMRSLVRVPTDAEITFDDHAGRLYARRYGMAPMVGPVSYTHLTLPT